MNDDEQTYLNALQDLNSNDHDEKKWLIHYFELYKFTLNWPGGFPPITRTNLIEGSLKKLFNSNFNEILNLYYYQFDNNKKQLLLLYKNNNIY
jgi:hypothetical protein